MRMKEVEDGGRCAIRFNFNFPNSLSSTNVIFDKQSQDHWNAIQESDRFVSDNC